MKKTAVFFTILFILLSMVNVCFANEANVSDENDLQKYKAKVLGIIETKEESYAEGSFNIITQKIQVKILNKDYKEQIVEAENNMSGNSAFDIKVKKGDVITVNLETNEEGMEKFYVTGHYRIGCVLQIIGIFLILLIIIGGWKGIKSIVSLGITILLIIYMMIPLLLKGVNPILVSVVVCAISTVVTMIIIAGLSKKAFSAIIGTVGGVVVGGSIAYLYGVLAKLTGLNSQEAQMLTYIPQQVQFDYRGLLFAGILIGALGAAMDVSISIASALTEIYEEYEDVSFKDILRHGMNIGRDIMGTMSNTLILAYSGGALSMILLFAAYKMPIDDIVNMDIIASEIIRAVSGSIGLLFAIPITTISFGLLQRR